MRKDPIEKRFNTKRQNNKKIWNTKRSDNKKKLNQKSLNKNPKILFSRTLAIKPDLGTLKGRTICLSNYII